MQGTDSFRPNPPNNADRAGDIVWTIHDGAFAERTEQLTPIFPRPFVPSRHHHFQYQTRLQQQPSMSLVHSHMAQFDAQPFQIVFVSDITLLKLLHEIRMSDRFQVLNDATLRVLSVVDDGLEAAYPHHDCFCEPVIACSRVASSMVVAFNRSRSKLFNMLPCQFEIPVEPLVELVVFQHDITVRFVAHVFTEVGVV